MDYDGTLVIGTDLDESGLDKRIRKLESKLKNEEIDLEIKASNVDNVKKEMQGISAEMKALIKQRNELNKSISSKKSQYDSINSNISAGKSISPEEYLRYGNLENQLSKLYAQQNQINVEVDKYNNSYNKLNDKLSVAEAHYDKQKNKVAETRAQVEDLNTEINKTNLENIKHQSNGIGNSLENIIKKVTRWGLAIFGVRSAYMFIRQAMGTLSQYNEKLGADVQYIRFALATALQPVIEKIINLVYKMLAYVNYIAKAWFGVNLFANATSKAFEKAQKGVKDTNKEAKKLNKTLAGFDEMNILQEDGSTKTGGGGGGVTLPSSDLSNLDNIEIPEWIQWIADNKDSILGTLRDIGIMIGVAFATIKVLEFLGVINKISTALGGISTLATFGVIAGFAMTLYGLIDLIGSLITGTASFESVLKDVGLAIAGVGLAMVALNASNPFGWVALVIGGITALAGILSDNTSKVKDLETATKDLEQAQRDVNEAYQDYVNASKTHLNAYKNYEKAQKDLTETAKKLKISEDKLNEIGDDLFEGIRNGTIDISTLKRGEEDLTKTYGLSKDQLLTVYEAYVNVKDSKAKLETATDKLTTSEEKLTEAQKKEVQEQLEKQRTLAYSTEKYEDYRDAVIDAYEKGAISGEDAKDRLIEAFAKTDKESRQVFVDGIPGYIQDMMKDSARIFGGFGIEWRSATDDMKIYTDSLAGKFDSKFGKDIPNSVQKTVDRVNKLKSSLEKLPWGKTLTMKVSTSSSSTSSKNAKGGIAYFAKGGIMRLPKLAPGGVINQPGRGVAIGGERGAEAVVPLTDTQQMELLGKAIGRYIKVALTNRVYVGNREVAREMKNIEAEENFAFNN